MPLLLRISTLLNITLRMAPMRESSRVFYIHEKRIAHVAQPFGIHHAGITQILNRQVRNHNGFNGSAVFDKETHAHRRVPDRTVGDRDIPIITFGGRSQLDRRGDALRSAVGHHNVFARDAVCVFRQMQSSPAVIWQLEMRTSRQESGRCHRCWCENNC